MISRLLDKSAEFARLLCKDIREFVSPPLCIGCGGDIDAENDFLCGGCAEKLTRENPGTGPICPFCGRPEGVSGRCRFCGSTNPLSLYFWGVYDGILKNCITEFKFRGMVDLGKWLSKSASDHLSGRMRQRRYDLVVPVPLYRARRREREFNQSEIIARIIADSLGSETNSEILIRVRRTAQQAKLYETERWKNVKNAFSTAQDHDLTGERILLVDDIVTTGATVYEAARPLFAVGADFVDIFSLAYAK